MNRDRSLIVKGMFLKGGPCAGVMPPSTPPRCGEELEEIKTRLLRIKSTIDYIRAQEPKDKPDDLSGDRIEWLLEHGYA